MMIPCGTKPLAAARGGSRNFFAVSLGMGDGPQTGDVRLGGLLHASTWENCRIITNGSIKFLGSLREDLPKIHPPSGTFPRFIRGNHGGSCGGGETFCFPPGVTQLPLGLENPLGGYLSGFPSAFIGKSSGGSFRIPLGGSREKEETTCSFGCRAVPWETALPEGTIRRRGHGWGGIKKRFRSVWLSVRCW